MNLELRLTAPSVAALRKTPAFGARLSALRALARSVDAWLERRRRVGRDRDTLAGMSDRELLDIGLDRGSVDAVASGRWMRDRID
jgi:uncharacterized protein YjiS (DUF1127 family)